MEALEDRYVPATLFVNNNADNGLLLGTLRWAVANAQNGDTIEILPAATEKAGLQVAVPLKHGELYLDHDVTIMGAGPAWFRPAIDGYRSRIFEVSPRAHVTLMNLYLQDGNGVANNPQGSSSLDGDGAAILNEGSLTIKDNDVAFNQHVHAGGAIYNFYGSLAMTNSAVYQNSAFSGGGVYNRDGAVVMTNTTMSGNTAAAGGGAIANENGVVWVGVNSLLQSNHAQNGGAVANFDGQVNISNSTLQENTASRDGGALFNLLDTMQVFDCVLLHNQAGREGGGIFNASAQLSVTGGSSLLDNTAGIDGGGISIESGTVVISDSKLSTNSATVGGAISNAQGTLTVTGCLVEFNSAMFGGGVFNGQGTLEVGTTQFVKNAPDHILGSWTDEGGNTFV
jgi:hypothetical protein